jgi:hypothetical protein
MTVFKSVFPGIWIGLMEVDLRGPIWRWKKNGKFSYFEDWM